MSRRYGICLPHLHPGLSQHLRTPPSQPPGVHADQLDLTPPTAIHLESFNNMSSIHLPRSHPPKNVDVPDELEPDTLPVEPDEGPVPDHIPDDPEHDRVIVPV